MEKKNKYLFDDAGSTISYLLITTQYVHNRRKEHTRNPITVELIRKSELTNVQNFKLIKNKRSSAFSYYSFVVII